MPQQKNDRVKMEQTMRWFGPMDPVPLAHIRQAGCTGVVTALHHVPIGDVWSPEEILQRKRLIESAGMRWPVVESLPVHEDIKKRSGDYARYLENYRTSLRNLAACEVRVITYNFMPVLDWMRTDPAWPLPDGSTALRFERDAFVAFDVFLLQRPGAETSYQPNEVERAHAYLSKKSEAEKKALFHNVLMGLPGGNESFTPSRLLALLDTYRSVDATALKQNLYQFLRDIMDVVEANDMMMAIHPDDPPFPVLGLPRVVSTEADVKELLEAVPSPANGLCFCTGSYGVRPDNDLPGMIRRHGDRIYFLHLRNTRRDAFGNFYEADHLDGDTDMVEVVREILLLMKRTGRSIPMRPDHGHQMLDDLQKKTNPGYTAIGRLKGLAELRGLELGLSQIL
jgi:mannonate dehydratase